MDAFTRQVRFMQVEDFISIWPRKGLNFGMRGELKHQPPKSQGFLVHEPSQHVGLLVESHLAGAHKNKTIELAGGKHMTAPAGEFRAASPLEIEEYHREAALIQPFALPSVQETAAFIHLR